MGRLGEEKDKPLLNPRRDIVIPRREVPSAKKRRERHQRILAGVSADELAGLFAGFKQAKEEELIALDVRKRTQIAEVRRILLGIEIIELRIIEEREPDDIRQIMKSRHKGSFSNPQMQSLMDKARNSFVDSYCFYILRK